MAKKERDKPALSCAMFGGSNDSEQYNALYSALSDAAELRGFVGPMKEYGLIENSDEAKIMKHLHTLPRTSMIVAMVNQLHELGYEIVFTGRSESNN